MSAARGRELVRELLASVAAARVGSGVIALVGAAVCAACLLTAGRSVATEQSLAAQLDRAGARVVSISDGSGTAGLTAAAVPRTAQLSHVEWTLGVGLFSDVRNAAVASGPTVRSRTMYGRPPPELQLLAGRWPAEGEAVVTTQAAHRLGLRQIAGAVTESTELGGTVVAQPVVGVFEATGILADLGADVLVASPATASEPLPQLIMLARHASDVPQLARDAAAASGVEDVAALRVRQPTDLAEVGRAAAGTLGRFARQMALLVLVVGLLLTAMTMLGMTLTRRRDLGRLRALGADRTTLALLVVTQAVVPTILGCAAGTAAALLTLLATGSSAPGFAFVAAVWVLTLLAAVVGALPAAASSAFVDPVRVLRVP